MRMKLLMAAAMISLAGAAQAQDKIKIGVLATLEGALTTLGEDALRGMEVAMKQAGGKAGQYPRGGTHGATSGVGRAQSRCSFV